MSSSGPSTASGRGAVGGGALRCGARLTSGYNGICRPICVASSISELPCVLALQLDAEPRTREIRTQLAMLWRERTVEEHVLDADVIVEVLDVAQPLERARRLRVQQGGAVRRERNAPRLAQGIHDEKPRDAAAARGVGLQYVDGMGIERRLEIRRRVAVLADRDLHPRGHK